MKVRAFLAAGATVSGLILTGCSSSHAASSTSSTSSPSSTTGAPGSSTTGAPGSTTTAASTTGAAICPTLAQAQAALGASYGGPITSHIQDGGIVCEYTSSAGNAGVTIFAHQSATVFAGQVSNAPGTPAMSAIPGVGDGAYGQTAGGRSVVNAYSNASRTIVAAQAPGAIGPVEALARVALADN